MSNLKHLNTVLAWGKVPVHKYRSEKTGLTIVIAAVEGPLVNGYFTLGKCKIGLVKKNCILLLLLVGFYSFIWKRCLIFSY